MYLLQWTKHSFVKEANARCSFPSSNSFCPASGKSPVLVVFFYRTNSPCTGHFCLRGSCVLARLLSLPGFCMCSLSPTDVQPGRKHSCKAKFWAGSHGCCPQSWVQPAGYGSLSWLGHGGVACIVPLRNFDVTLARLLLSHRRIVWA